jgi:phosphatidylinositol alpha-mannosyltransferase
VRIGIVCPYSWDIPGGVQAHVRDLAEKLIQLGHDVSVLAPGDDDTPDLPPYVVVAGKAAVRIPYNGSVAHLQFGLVAAARVRRWLRDGAFDVVHVHEPAPPSLSLLTCMIHDGPLVATFHMAVTRSRWLSAFDAVLQPFLEKITGKIAVSPAARITPVPNRSPDIRGRDGRSASSAAMTSRARAWTCSSPRSNCSPPNVRGCASLSPGAVTRTSSWRACPTVSRTESTFWAR